jgi:hypothetical protein
MNIFESINAVMSDIGAVGKTSKNQQQGFMFRGIDAVMNAINPALVKNKVFIVPEIIDQTREERTNTKGTTLIYSMCKIKYTFYAEDGTSISATVIGEGMDTGDKATNKAMSIAFKYACFQVFCIPTEEMADPDAECHEVKAKAEEPKSDLETRRDELVKMLIQKKIDFMVVFKLYKVEAFKDMRIDQIENAIKNIDKIKEKAEEMKNE